MGVGVIVYVDGLHEPVQLDYYTYHTQWSQMLPELRARFEADPDSSIWIVPSQTCPECATRRNLEDSPGA